MIVCPPSPLALPKPPANIAVRARLRIGLRRHDIRAVADAEGVPLVDAEEIFARASPVGIPGEDFFLEHVHLSFAGNYLLARSICEKLLDLPLTKPAKDTPMLAADECGRRLAHTDWNRLMVAKQILAMMSQPPFTGQLGFKERDQRWQKKIEHFEGWNRR